MLDYSILEAHGVTTARLREIFTAEASQEPSTPPRGESKEDKKIRIAREKKLANDINIRERFRKRLQTRIEEGVVQGLMHWKKFAAVDLAWDTSMISGLTLPLQLYAQNKISVERAKSLLGICDNQPLPPGTENYVSKDEAGKYQVDIPRFVETHVNLVRSIITRRHGAQKVKFGELWPYYKYEARSTGLVAKCRADVLSQRADMMADQFGYRHHESQVMLDGFLYAQILDVVTSRWVVEKQWRKKDINGAATTDNIETVITKEGVDWFNPRPTHVFWDNSAPLCSLNTDTGCSYFGFWDVGRFSQIDNDPLYYNKERVGWTGKFWGQGGIYSSNTEYFSHYQYQILSPGTGEQDPAMANDRKASLGFYCSSKQDSSVLYANYFEKLIPKAEGIGEYPYPVWVRFVVTSDATVIFSEVMPSTPAAVLGMNVRDSRQMNLSMAMNLMTYQDQMTNLTTHLMLLCQIQLFKAIGINKDLVDENQLKEITAQLKGRNWCSDPLIFAYSLAKLQEIGIKPSDAITIAETNQGATISSILEAMLKLVQFVEKMEALSPNEQGQPAPREISATEVTEISNTTSSVYSSISADVDEYRSAKKRIVYESTVACHEGQIVCPVKDRYTDKTIEAAGFTKKEGEDEDYQGDAKQRTVIGTRFSLIHDYIFTTRDGAERPVNTQAANTLVQLIGQVLSTPQIAQACGKSKLYELFNEVFRLSGAGVDLNLQMKEGEDDTLGPDEMAQMKDTLDQMTPMIQQLAGHVQKNSQDLAQQDQMNQHQEEAIKGLSELAQRVSTNAKDVQDLRGRHDEINKRLVETISYKDAPDDIKSQMEAQAGFTPARNRKNSSDKPAPAKK